MRNGPSRWGWNSSDVHVRSPFMLVKEHRPVVNISSVSDSDIMSLIQP